MAKYYYAEYLTSGNLPRFKLCRFKTMRERDAFVLTSPNATKYTSHNAWANHREQLQIWDKSDELDKIKLRITKLLALANDTSTPNEAAIAASRARHLMDKYQLDDIEVVLGSKITEVTLYKSKRVPTWVKNLVSVIAKFNDCLSTQTKYSKYGETHIKIKGYPDDVSLSEAMYAYLVRQITKQSKAARISKSDSKPANVGNYFRLGFVQGIGQQFNDIKRDTIYKGQGLAVRKLDNIKDETIMRGTARVTKVRQPTQSEAAAYVSGIASGKSADISPKVE